MAAKTPLNFELVRVPRIRAICHNAVDTDQEWNQRPVKLRPTKEFLEHFNQMVISLLLRSMDSACLHGRTTLKPEDIPTLESMGLDSLENLGVQVANSDAVE